MPDSIHTPPESGKDPGSDGITDFGFRWGPVDVTRCAVVGRDIRIVEIAVNDRRTLTIYVSRTGRSVRVYRDGVELTASSSPPTSGETENAT